MFARRKDTCMKSKRTSSSSMVKEWKASKCEIQHKMSGGKLQETNFVIESTEQLSTDVLAYIHRKIPTTFCYFTKFSFHYK